jgi:hypothetical protein
MEVNMKRRDFLKVWGSSPFVSFDVADKIPNGENASAQNAPSPGTPGGQLYTRRHLAADVLVAGGGLAGVCAALAAARNGASVILVQDRSRLGGNSSSEIRMHVLGANSPKELRLWRETGIIEELKLTDAATNPQRSFEMWDLLLYSKIITEKNITLLLDSSVVSAEIQGSLISGATAMSPLLEEICDLEARFFIDCTGDAALSALCGAELMRGREGQDIYGESLAPARGDRKTMGNSILFFARRHDGPMPFSPPSWARRFAEPDFKHRPIRSWEYGYWWIEWGGDIDTVKDNRRIRHELLRAVMGIWDYIKNSGKHPDSLNWALDWVGMIPGKRESRRIRGAHVLKQQELMLPELFPDRVSYGGWPIDDHPPGGIDRTDIAPYTQIHFKQPYSIPLRSLHSANRRNLLMAGRNISASHVALASTRVMATCAAMGQAAGTVAAFCTRHKLLPDEVTSDPSRVRQLQQLLLKDDQSLLAVTNEDPGDLARTAQVRASAVTAAGRASCIADGWSRDIGDGRSHQWQAPMDAPGPWIELSWPQAQQINQIQITFDSGLHRLLYLTGQDSEYLSQKRGPQPETVADYTLEARVDSRWIILAEVKGNFLRLARHQFEPFSATAVRLQIRRTNGDSLARVFEVRCY